MSTHQLFYALNREDLDHARQLLDAGVDVNFVLPDEGVAPMHLAAGLGTQAIKLLLEYAADPNIRSTDGYTPLHIAATWGEIENVRLLLYSGADPHVRDQDGFQPVDVAKTYGHNDCVCLLKYYSLLLFNTEVEDDKPKYIRESMDNLSSCRTPIPMVNICRDNNVACDIASENWNNHNCIHSPPSSYTDVFQRHFYDCVRQGKRIFMDVTSPHHPTIHTRESPQCSVSDGGKYPWNRGPCLSRRKTMKILDSGLPVVSEVPSRHVYEYHDAAGNTCSLNKVKTDGANYQRNVACNCDNMNSRGLHLQEQSPRSVCGTNRKTCPQKPCQTCTCQPVAFSPDHSCFEMTHQCRNMTPRHKHQTLCLQVQGQKQKQACQCGEGCFIKSSCVDNMVDKTRTLKCEPGVGTPPSRFLLDTLERETPEAKLDRWHSSGLFNSKQVYEIKPKSNKWFQPLVEPVNTSETESREYTVQPLKEHSDTSNQVLRQSTVNELLFQYSESGEPVCFDVTSPNHPFVDKKSSQVNDSTMLSTFNSSNSLFSESLNHSINAELSTLEDLLPTGSPNSSPVNDRKPPVHPGKNSVMKNNACKNSNNIPFRSYEMKTSPHLDGRKRTLVIDNQLALHQFLSSRQKGSGCQQQAELCSEEKESGISSTDHVKTDSLTNAGEKEELLRHGCDNRHTQGEHTENTVDVINDGGTSDDLNRKEDHDRCKYNLAKSKINQKASFSKDSKNNLGNGKDYDSYKDFLAESKINLKSTHSDASKGDRLASNDHDKDRKILAEFKSGQKPLLSDKPRDTSCRRLFSLDPGRHKDIVVESETSQKSGLSGTLHNKDHNKDTNILTESETNQKSSLSYETRDAACRRLFSPDHDKYVNVPVEGRLGSKKDLIHGDSKDRNTRESDVSSCDTFMTCQDDTEFTMVTHLNEHSEPNVKISISTAGDSEISRLPEEWRDCQEGSTAYNDTLTGLSMSCKNDNTNHTVDGSWTHHEWVAPDPNDDVLGESDIMTSDESFMNHISRNNFSCKVHCGLPPRESACSNDRKHKAFTVNPASPDMEKTPTNPDGGNKSLNNKNGVLSPSRTSDSLQNPSTGAPQSNADRQKTPVMLKKQLFLGTDFGFQNTLSQQHKWQAPQHLDNDESDLMTSDESFLLRNEKLVEAPCESIEDLVNTFGKVGVQSTGKKKVDDLNVYARGLSKDKFTRELSTANITKGPSENISIGLCNNVLGRPSKENVLGRPSKENVLARLSKENVSRRLSKEKVSRVPSINNITSGQSNENITRRQSEENTTLSAPSAQSVLNRRLSAVTGLSISSSPDTLDVGFCRRSSLDSIYSHLSCKEYVYRDTDTGVVLIERHIPSDYEGSSIDRQSFSSSVFSVQTVDSQDTEIYDWKAYQSDCSESKSCQSDCNESKSYQSDCSELTADGRGVSERKMMPPQLPTSVPECLSQLSNNEVRDKLKSLGDDPGPVVPSTRQLYLVRLATIQADPHLVQHVMKLTDSVPGYSHELRLALQDNLDLCDMDELEVKMVAQFENPQGRKWREGTIKSSFNYLLLDPRVTKNLPLRAKHLGDLETFKIFIAAIFYVGKGKRSRPYSHLYEAISHMQTPKPKTSSKVQHIVDIWQEGVGVVSLHCFQSTIPVEAYTREACMVEAFGLPKLTNMKKGDFYGTACSWSLKQKRKMGVFLLKKALQIFLSDGERQICPYDIKQGQ
ncbi:uncharacterized protein LOC121386397 [Gigantopelta aegis]|uniref:uncharacterized protein LOC121386397 n=1 Tax=Gigantopelta aegis TaxID=1735272 RepID=UPI001B88C598|nr:uncharacterized protein LOC121386397 [Gigantopelta aegis]